MKGLTRGFNAKLQEESHMSNKLVVSHLPPLVAGYILQSDANSIRNHQVVATKTENTLRTEFFNLW
jgi:hypothetical protein